MMRIAMFSDNFYPELSGIADSIILVARELARRGHRIHIYAPRYTRANHELLGLPSTEINLGDCISVTRLASLPYPTGTGQGRMVVPTGVRWRLLRRFCPDVVHVHLPFGLGLEGMLAARILGKPLVGTNHTPLTEFLRYSPIQGDWLGRLATRYTAWFYKHCAFVSSPSRAIFDAMQAFHFRAPHSVMSNPIRLDEFVPLGRKGVLKKKFGFSTPTILYAGRLAPEKQLDLLVEAVAALALEFPTLGLALLGRGTEEDNLKSLSRSLGVERRVKFLGFIPEVSQLAEAYNASEVFAIPSTAETQCIAAMQGMACGLPVVGVRSWGLKEYINDANGILVDAGDGNALARALAHLLHHPEECLRLGNGGREFVKRFSSAAIAAEWEEIYGHVVGEFQLRPDLAGFLSGEGQLGEPAVTRGTGEAPAADRSQIR